MNNHQAEPNDGGRKRAPNFTRRENKVLAELAQHYQGTIESKKTNHLTNSEKNRAWVELARDFNAKLGGEPYRSAIVLKHRYGNMKKEASRRLRKENQIYFSGTSFTTNEIMQTILNDVNADNVSDTEDTFVEDEAFEDNDLEVKELIEVKLMADNGTDEQDEDEDPLTTVHNPKVEYDSAPPHHERNQRHPQPSMAAPLDLEEMTRKCYLEQHQLKMRQMRQKHQLELELIRQEFRDRMKMMSEEHEMKMKLLELEKTVGIMNKI